MTGTFAPSQRIAQEETKAIAAVGASPFPLDIGRVINNVNSAFNPLHRDCVLDYNVAGVREGFVCLQIVLPEGMTRAFVSMLESMSGLFRCIDIKERSAASQEKTVEPDRIAENKKAVAEFTETVCALFDTLISCGIPVNEAVKRTNMTLKAQGNVWSTYSVVMDTLRAAGRFRKSKSKKKGRLTGKPVVNVRQ